MSSSLFGATSDVIIVHPPETNVKACSTNAKTKTSAFAEVNQGVKKCFNLPPT